jgi:AmmeMemoRadiSam system protein B
LGSPIAVSFEDWKTPLGAVKCDLELADAIIKAGKTAAQDEIAHLQEHSCEVQLPFLQTVAPQLKIACICMGWQEIEYAQELGKAIFEAVRKTKRNAIIIASSDFTHYEEAGVAEKKDRAAIAKLLGMDEAGFLETAEALQVSACGAGPIAAAMHYSKLAGAKKCELLKYTNSGEATKDYSSVVGYASLAIR